MPGGHHDGGIPLRRKRKLRRFLVAGLVILFAGLLMLPITGDNPVSRLAGRAALPLRQGKERVEDFLRRAQQTMEGLEALEKENTMLKAQLAQLEREVLAGESARREAERLRVLLGFSAAQNSMEYLPVRILSREQSPLHDGFTLVTEGAGATGDWIITPGGELLGVVSTPGEGWCTALTLRDRTVTLSVWVGEEEIPAAYQGAGTGEMGELLYLEADAPVEVGDLVVTAGLGGQAPPGLTVGRVSEVTPAPGGLTLTARVETSEPEPGEWGYELIVKSEERRGAAGP